MTRVRRLAVVALTAPMMTGAFVLSGSAPARAAGCWPLSSATIGSPAGSLREGSTVQVSATVSGMLLGAHMHVTGPGTDETFGTGTHSGTITGSVPAARAGDYTVTVVGDGTSCVYDTRGFSVKAAPAASAKPSKHHGSSGSSRGSSGRGRGDPRDLPFGGGTSDSAVAKPPSGNSPFSLPSAAPGDAPGFQYPTPDPELASPASRTAAHNTVATTPIKWEKSVAIALILLLLSAHLGMWSRRQRLATSAAGRPGRTGGTASREPDPTPTGAAEIGGAAVAPVAEPIAQSDAPMKPTEPTMKPGEAMKANDATTRSAEVMGPTEAITKLGETTGPNEAIATPGEAITNPGEAMKVTEVTARPAGTTDPTEITAAGRIGDDSQGDGIGARDGDIVRSATVHTGIGGTGRSSGRRVSGRRKAGRRRR